MSAQVTPSDLDAEAVALSAAINDRAAFDDVALILRPPHFYAEANRRIWEAALALDAEGRTVDVTSLAGYLRDKKQLEAVGGAAYLAQIVAGTPAVAHADEHARRVVEKWRSRRIIEECRRFAAVAHSDDVDDAQALALNAAQALSDIAQEDGVRGGPEGLDTLLPRTLDVVRERHRGGSPTYGVPTGLYDYDRKLGGCLLNSHLHIVAGRPGMGKTAFILALLAGAAKQGIGAAAISVEMDREQLAMRFLAAESGIATDAVMSGSMREDKLEELALASERIDRLPLCIDDVTGGKATIGAIRASVRTMQRNLAARGARLGIVGIDYLQILDGEPQKGESREQEIARLTKRLLWMAQEFGVPVVVGSQLNRSVESRAEKRPLLSDLRESGAIEQDAYTVTLLYRDEYYEPKSKDRGVLEANVGKNRNGSTGTVKLHFSAHSTGIHNLAGWGDSEASDDQD